MYAIFELSGFQYRAEKGAILKVPTQSVPAGDSFEITDVLLVKNNDSALIGTPTVEGAKVEASVLGNKQGGKVMVFKKKRRTKYRRTQGHRQEFSEIKITNIVAP